MKQPIRSFRKTLARIFPHGFWDLFLGAIMLLLVGTLLCESFLPQPSGLCIEMIDAGQPVQSRMVMSRRAESPLRLSRRIQGDESTAPMPCSPYPALVCSILSEKNDLYFWVGRQFQDMLAVGALTDLRQILSPALLEQYRDQLVYTGPLLEGGYPCAIELKNNWWAMENGQYELCCVGVDRNSRNMDQAVQFLNFILQ